MFGTKNLLSLLALSSTFLVSACGEPPVFEADCSAVSPVFGEITRGIVLDPIEEDPDAGDESEASTLFEPDFGSVFLGAEGIADLGYESLEWVGR